MSYLGAPIASPDPLRERELLAKVKCLAGIQMLQQIRGGEEGEEEQGKKKIEQTL